MNNKKSNVVQLFPEVKFKKGQAVMVKTSHLHPEGIKEYPGVIIAVDNREEIALVESPNGEELRRGTFTFDHIKLATN